MGGENQNTEVVINEERSELIGYISYTGKICLRQESGIGEGGVSIIHIDPFDVDVVMGALRDLKWRAEDLAVQAE